MYEENFVLAQDFRVQRFLVWLGVGAVVRCVPGVEWTEEGGSHPLHGGQEAEGGGRKEGWENLVPLSRMT